MLEAIADNEGVSMLAEVFNTYSEDVRITRQIAFVFSLMADHGKCGVLLLVFHRLTHLYQRPRQMASEVSLWTTMSSP